MKTDIMKKEFRDINKVHTLYGSLLVSNQQLVKNLVYSFKFPLYSKDQTCLH
jgi:hypothetical protein